MADNATPALTALQERVDGLESRLAFQDNTIAALNDALVSQQAQVTLLERSLARALKQIETQYYQGEEPEDGPPPHY